MFPPGQLPLPVRAAPGVPVLLQRPDIRQPEGQRPLHDVALRTRRLALPAVVTLPVETRVVTCRRGKGTNRNPEMQKQTHEEEEDEEEVYVRMPEVLLCRVPPRDATCWCVMFTCIGVMDGCFASLCKLCFLNLYKVIIITTFICVCLKMKTQKNLKLHLTSVYMQFMSRTMK